jgi:hypothetical protein
MDQQNFSGHGVYEIKVKGHIGEAWSSWFEDMAITTGFAEEGMPVTTFTGPIIDQATLHGVLARIRDIHLPLISVCPVNTINPLGLATLQDVLSYTILKMTVSK